MATATPGTTEGMRNGTAGPGIRSDRQRVYRADE